jgi:uncharacterized protein (DUF1697 family)
MRWVALLRAVNLGPDNKVPMAELRAALEEAGYDGVRTYIASGNVLLEGPSGRAKLGAALERLVAESFGVTTTVILRKPRELASLVAAHPFGGDTAETHVAFLAERPTKAAAARLAAVDPGADLAVLSGTDLYLRLPRGVHGSRLSIARIEKLLGVRATLRNWRTAGRLAELAAEA